MLYCISYTYIYTVVFVNSYGCISRWTTLLVMTLVSLWMHETITAEWCRRRTGRDTVTIPELMANLFAQSITRVTGSPTRAVGNTAHSKNYCTQQKNEVQCNNSCHLQYKTTTTLSWIQWMYVWLICITWCSSWHNMNISYMIKVWKFEVRGQ